jgi:hypothetical protein
MFHSFKFAFFLGLFDLATEGFSDFVPFNSFARFLEKRKNCTSVFIGKIRACVSKNVFFVFKRGVLDLLS